MKQKKCTQEGFIEFCDISHCMNDFTVVVVCCCTLSANTHHCYFALLAVHLSYFLKDNILFQ